MNDYSRTVRTVVFGTGLGATLPFGAEGFAAYRRNGGRIRFPRPVPGAPRVWGIGIFPLQRQ